MIAKEMVHRIDPWHARAYGKPPVSLAGMLDYPENIAATREIHLSIDFQIKKISLQKKWKNKKKTEKAMVSPPFQQYVWQKMFPSYARKIARKYTILPVEYCDRKTFDHIRHSIYSTELVSQKIVVQSSKCTGQIFYNVYLYIECNAVSCSTNIYHTNTITLTVFPFPVVPTLLHYFVLIKKRRYYLEVYFTLDRKMAHQHPDF